MTSSVSALPEAPSALTRAEWRSAMPGGGSTMSNVMTVDQSRSIEARDQQTGDILPIPLPPWFAAEPRWLRPTTSALLGLLRLRPNWDSYGAPPISRHAVEVALELLLLTARVDTPAPAVVPTTTSGVALEWHKRAFELEIEIGQVGDVHVLYEGSHFDHMADVAVFPPYRELQRLFAALSDSHPL